ncbi:Tc5 transposase DNA-binding domain, partial [Phytophthora infestans]
SNVLSKSLRIAIDTNNLISICWRRDGTNTTPTQDGTQWLKVEVVQTQAILTRNDGRCTLGKKLRAVIEAKVAGGSQYHQHSRTLGTSALSAEVEEQLAGWINELRADGVPVTSMMLQLQAQELFRTRGSRNKLLKASWSCRKHFFAPPQALYSPPNPRKAVYTGRRKAEGGGAQGPSTPQDGRA